MANMPAHRPDKSADLRTLEPSADLPEVVSQAGAADLLNVGRPENNSPNSDDMSLKQAADLLNLAQIQARCLRSMPPGFSTSVGSKSEFRS